MEFTRREFLAASIAGFSGLGPRGVRLSSQQAPSVRPTFSSIRGNVGTMIGRGGTIGWLITGNGTVVVDTQFPDMAAICQQFLAQQSKNQELKAVFNTHHHRDHTSGNAALRKAARQIVGHQNVPRLMKQTPQDENPPHVVPDTTFTNEWDFKVGHEEIEVRHWGPAHTGGDAIVTFTRANVVHLGDLVFNGRHPVIDRASGGSIEGWIQVLRRVVSEHSPETEYIFGHAEPAAAIRGRESEVNRMRDYLMALQSHVLSALKMGRLKDEQLKTGSVLEAFENYGPVPDPVLSAAYDEFGPRG